MATPEGPPLNPSVDTAPKPSEPAKTALLGAMFLMATSAVGPGFITQTTEFTVELGAAFALVPAPTLLIDIDGAGHDLAPAKYDAAQRTLDAAVSLFESLPADRPGVVPLFDPSR